MSHLDEWWHRKYADDGSHKLVRVEATPFATKEGPDEPVHLPSPSYWPIIVAAGIPLVAYGLLYTYWLSAVGGLLIVGGIFGWGFEPSVDPDAGHHPNGGGHDGDGGAHAADTEDDREPALVGAGEESS